MKDSLFRQKSIERISSPEEIDAYMKVTSPSMWLILGAVIFLLFAILVWSITGRIEEQILIDGQVKIQEIAPIELLLN